MLTDVDGAKSMHHDDLWQLDTMSVGCMREQCNPSSAFSLNKCTAMKLDSSISSQSNQTCPCRELRLHLFSSFFIMRRMHRVEKVFFAKVLQSY